MPNRYVCSALEEFRVYLDLMYGKYELSIREQSHIGSLLEEVQTYVNRMEASLGDQWDMHFVQDQLRELKLKKRKIKKEVKELEDS